MLKAEHGDCFIISTLNEKNKKFNILVDGGTRNTYRRFMKPTLQEIINNKECLDLIISTHIDDDHISGIIQLFNDKQYIKELNPKKIFYNFYDEKTTYKKDNYISYVQGNELSKLLKEYNSSQKNEFNKLEITQCSNSNSYRIDGIVIEILSPNINNINNLFEKWREKNNNISSKTSDYSITIEDFKDNVECSYSSITNYSSIAFILKAENKSILMMGDAHPNSITDVLKEKGYSVHNKLCIDAVKLSHHGGDNSISEEFLNIIRCNKFLISSNGKIHNHPKKKTLVDIIRRNSSAELYLNYKRGVFSENEIKDFGILYFEDKCLIEI